MRWEENWAEQRANRKGNQWERILVEQRVEQKDDKSVEQFRRLKVVPTDVLKVGDLVYQRVEWWENSWDRESVVKWEHQLVVYSDE
jgi:hypothetical protein